jgi:hypothetical protein
MLPTIDSSGRVCVGVCVSLISLIAFIVVIASHAVLYVWTLSCGPLTRDFRRVCKPANGAESASIGR